MLVVPRVNKFLTTTLGILERIGRKRLLAIVIVLTLVITTTVFLIIDQVAQIDRLQPQNGTYGRFKQSCQKADPTQTERANAAIVMLARNYDVDGAVDSIKSFEAMFNKNYNYPYVFLNNEEFDDYFKYKVSEVASGRVEFALVPSEDWEFPNVDSEVVDQAATKQGDRGIPYGYYVSYHKMCRYFSGKFFLHPAVAKYEFYWRLEPNVEFMCEIGYDVFLEMKNNNKHYGFNTLLREMPSTLPGLERHVQAFRRLNAHRLPVTDTWGVFMSKGNYWFSMDGEYYNLCHFWTNFEIARVDLWSQPLYQELFEYLDSAGGFWAERWGDAPVHTFGVAMLLNTSQVHYFRDIGYKHTRIGHCPKQRHLGCNCKCKDYREVETNMCFSSFLNVAAKDTIRPE